MAVTHSLPGGTDYLSGNPIEIVITASAAKDNHRTAVKVKCDELISVEQIDEREPIDLVSKHNLQGLLDEPLPVEFHFPVTGVASAHAALVLNVDLEIGEIWNDENGDRQESFTPISDSLRVLDGKLFQHELAVLNEAGKSFASEYIEGGKFLTSQPNNQKVSIDQYVKLWYLSRWTGAHTVYLMTKITTWDKVGRLPISQEIVLYPTTGLLELSLNPIFQGFAPALRELITGYEVWLEDEAGDVSEHRTYVVDQRVRENQLFGFFRNKFSAVESFWFRGEKEEGLKTDIETAYTALPSGSGTKKASIKTVSNTGSRYIEVNTGVLKRTEMLGLRDFIQSKERWIIDPDNSTKLIPVYIEGGDFKLNDTRQDIQSIAFKLIEAHV